VEQALEERWPEHIKQMFLDTMVSLTPVAVIMILSPTIRTFAGRLRMIHRPQSADLSELALLPGLGGRNSPLANYCLVIFGRPLRMIAAIAALLGGTAVMLVRFTPWSMLLLVVMIAGITVLEISRYLAFGRPYIRSIILETLAFMPVLMLMCALAFFGTRATNAISHVVIPAIVVIVLIAAIQGFRRAYATATQLPHPFLDADERRVVTIE
jgi:hypothetical protein